MLGFALIPGQAFELRAAPALLLASALIGAIGRVVCDGAYSSAAWCALVIKVGALPVVGSNPTHPSTCTSTALPIADGTGARTSCPGSKNGAPSPHDATDRRKLRT